GGDDYELLFAAPAARRADVDAISASLGLALHRTGTLTPEPATPWLRQRDGRLVPGTRSGYEHFGWAPPAVNPPLGTTRPPPMRPTARLMMSHPAHFISLGFGSGLSPWAPGTMGTLLACALYPLIRTPLSEFVFLALLTSLFVAGVLAAERTGRA